MTSRDAARFKQHMAKAHQALEAGDVASGTEQFSLAIESAGTVGELRSVAASANVFGLTALAKSVFERILADDPTDVRTFKSLSQMQRDHAEALVAAMQARFETLEGEERAILGFALGKVFHDRGEHQRAFGYYEAGNMAQKALIDTSDLGNGERLEELRSVFGTRAVDRFAGGGVKDFRPIFIVGMPRCGSTLTEQILSSHPDVFAGGEIPLVDGILSQATQKGRLSLSRLMTSVKPEAFTILGRSYVDTVRSAMGAHARITDKYLPNIYNVGFIRLMFPNAKVILSLRDPLDNAFAIYRLRFTQQTTGMRYAYDLAQIGREYRLHLEMADLWDKLYPGFVYRQNYADLVTDFEPAVRRLVAHCELEWHDACLDFHRNTRGVKTSSLAQVRQPLFKDGLDSSKPYRQFLGPFLDALTAKPPSR